MGQKYLIGILFANVNIKYRPTFTQMCNYLVSSDTDTLMKMEEHTETYLVNKNLKKKNLPDIKEITSLSQT